MHDFFISLRGVLAKARTASIDSMAMTPVLAIENIYIPEMVDLIQKAREGSVEYEQLRATLDEWRESMDRRKNWKTMLLNVLPAHLESDQKEEVAGFMLQKAWEAPVRGLLRRFDPAKGPTQFAKYWKTILYNLMKYGIRETMKPSPLLQQEAVTEGPQVETELSKQEFAYLAKELNQYVLNRVDAKAQAVWKLWLENALKKGGDKVNLKHDVIGPLVAQGVGGKTILWNRWKKEIVPEILRFFRLELERPLSKKQRKKMFKVGGSNWVDQLAVAHWRRTVAAWMLSSQLVCSQT